jgi:Ca2+/Na+ antiporter
MEYITTPLMITGYIVLFYFFILFYRNYKSISTTVNSKTLMEQILKTRKTVKYYVVFNLIFLYVSMAIGVMIELNKNPDVLLQTSKFSESGDFYIFYGIVILITLLAMGVITVFFLVFYYLIYGILLKKLKKNYKELKAIEKQ